MSEQWKSIISKLVFLQLRLAVVAYVFATIYPYIAEPGFETTVWNWLLRWGLIILMGIVLLGMFAMQRSDFLRYGFFLVLVVGFFNLFNAILIPGMLRQIFVHFFAIAVAVYFVSRDVRHEVVKHKRHKHKS
jgi:hypothetical protein